MVALFITGEDPVVFPRSILSPQASGEKSTKRAQREESVWHRILLWYHDYPKSLSIIPAAKFNWAMATS